MLTNMVHVTFLVVSMHVKVQTDCYKTVISGHLGPGAGGTARGAVTLPFIFFSIALIFSQQVCMSFILGKKRNFHFEKITVRPPKTEAGRTSLGQGNALRL